VRSPSGERVAPVIEEAKPNEASRLRLIHRQETDEDTNSADWRTVVSRLQCTRGSWAIVPGAVTFRFGRLSFRI